MTSLHNHPALLMPDGAPPSAVITPFSNRPRRVIAVAAQLVHVWPRMPNPTRAEGIAPGSNFLPGWTCSIIMAVTALSSTVSLLLGRSISLAASGTTEILRVPGYARRITTVKRYCHTNLSLIRPGATRTCLSNGGSRYPLDRLHGKDL